MPQHPRPPQWEDVHFDHQLADAAIAALRLSATAVVTAAGCRSALALTATHAWQGPHRDYFVLALAGVQANATHLTGLLLAQAAAIQGAADAAHAEQRRRLADRERYRREVSEASRDVRAARRHAAA